jgi:hypothetical protein
VGKRYEEMRWTWASYAISCWSMHVDRYTHQVIWHLRTRVRHIVGLVHTIHDAVCNATTKPRVLSLLGW